MPGKGTHLRRNLSSSSLVRLLGAGNALELASPRQDVAERLGQWLNVARAITLHSALQAIPSVTGPRPSGARSSVEPELAAQVQKLRATLGKSIAAGDAESGSDAEYGSYHQRYLEQQRRMDLGVDALRAHARQTLSKLSPQLAQLAALDAVLAEMLGGREQQLLSAVPVFLRKRFTQLQRQHQSASGADQDAASETAPPQAAWLATFAAEFEETLLAELDVRLQPVIGMLEALNHHMKK